MPLPAPLRHIPFRLLQKLGSHIRVPIGDRQAVVPLSDAAALAWLYWRPGWTRALIRAILPQRGGAFVDIGVNVGQSLADFISTGLDGRYIGFEPNPRCVTFVRDLIAATGLMDAELLPVGLSSSTGVQRLHFTSASGTDQTASLIADLRPAAVRRTEYVVTTTFDAALAMSGPTKIGLVKIDVEGAELEVLQGMGSALAREAPPIICEVLLHDAAADRARYAARMEALRALLQAHGYRLFRLAFGSGAAFTGLQAIERFPLEPWTPARASECDYLFLPRGFDGRGLGSQ